MNNLKNFKKAAGVAALSVGLVACSQSEILAITDERVNTMLRENADNPQGLIGEGDIVWIATGDNDLQLWYVSIIGIQDKQTELCASYEAYNLEDIGMNFNGKMTVNGVNYSRTCAAHADLIQADRSP